MAILKNLFCKTDPLEAKAGNLVSVSHVMATQRFIRLIDRYKFLERCSPQDWDFFATIATVQVALIRLTSEVSNDQFKRLVSIIVAQVQKLDRQGEGALADCQRFAIRNGPEEITLALGLWVLSNVLRREPTDEEMQAAPVIGGALAEPFFDWWHAK